MRTRRRARRLLSGEGTAALRCGAGTILLIRPGGLADVLGADPALSRTGDWAVRMQGARELALGLGALAAAGARPADRGLQGPDD